MPWIVAVLSLGGLAAAVFEAWLATRAHPRRFAYAWAAWTPLAVLGFLGMLWEDLGPAGALLLAPILGIGAYPIMRGFIWLRFEQRYSQPEEDAKDLERMRYQAVDFGGVRTAPEHSTRDTAQRSQTAQAAIVDAPLTMPIGPTALDRTIRDQRPAWLRGAEIAFAVGGTLVGITLYLASMFMDLAHDEAPSPEEMVAATLEVKGFGAPRVSATDALCADARSAAYAWSAFGAAGRACVDPTDGQVTLWVEQRWPPPG